MQPIIDVSKIRAFLDSYTTTAINARVRTSYPGLEYIYFARFSVGLDRQKIDKDREYIRRILRELKKNLQINSEEVTLSRLVEAMGQHSLALRLGILGAYCDIWRFIE